MPKSTAWKVWEPLLRQISGGDPYFGEWWMRLVEETYDIAHPSERSPIDVANCYANVCVAYTIGAGGTFHAGMVAEALTLTEASHSGPLPEYPCAGDGISEEWRRLQDGQSVERYLYITPPRASFQEGLISPPPESFLAGLISPQPASVLAEIASDAAFRALEFCWSPRRNRLIQEWQSRQPPLAAVASYPRMHGDDRDPPARVVIFEIAPDEGTIREYVERAKSCPDHWDALRKAAKMLRLRRQPLGEALSDWLPVALDVPTRRPKGSKAAKGVDKAVRNACIVGAVRAIGQQCAMPAMTQDRAPGPACDVVADVFGLRPRTVLEIWKSLKG